MFASNVESRVSRKTLSKYFEICHDKSDKLPHVRYYDRSLMRDTIKDYRDMGIVAQILYYMRHGSIDYWNIVHEVKESAFVTSNIATDRLLKYEFDTDVTLNYQRSWTFEMSKIQLDKMKSPGYVRELTTLRYLSIRNQQSDLLLNEMIVMSYVFSPPSLYISIISKFSSNVIILSRTLDFVIKFLSNNSCCSYEWLVVFPLQYKLNYFAFTDRSIHSSFLSSIHPWRHF